MSQVSPDTSFTSINGNSYPLRDWLTSYPFFLVALDPYTNESSWILEAAGDLLHHFSPADIRVGWIATTDEEGCRTFLGPWEEKFLTFPDPDRKLVTELGLEELPALIHIRSDGFLEVANGWNPEQWNEIAATISKQLSWSKPQVPKPGDPTPFSGTPAAS